MAKRQKSAGRKIDLATTKKKKGDRVLSDKELQNIVDHDFTTLSSDDDEEENALEDEYTTASESNDSDCDNKRESDNEDFDVFTVNLDFDDSPTSSGVQSSKNSPPAATNLSPATSTSPPVNITPPPLPVTAVNSPPVPINLSPATTTSPPVNTTPALLPVTANQSPTSPVNLNKWHTVNLKPKLLKFTGQEKVNLPDPPPQTAADFFDDKFIDNIIQFTNDKAKQLTHMKPQNRKSPLRFSKM